MAAGSIVVDMLMNTGSFETDTKRAEKILKSLEKEARASAAAFKASFAGNLLSDFVQKVTAVLIRLPGEILNSLDAFNDLSDATGASVENISALDAVARRTGASFETVEAVLIKFNKVLSEAGNNSAGDALKELGLNAEELKRIDPAEALRLAAVALAGFADGGNKARIIQELFGKSVKDAAPLLKDLAEQSALAATTTTAQAQAAEDLNKSISAFSAAATDFARSMASSILPALNEAILKFKDAQDSYGSMWDALSDAGGGRADPFKNTTERISIARAEMAKLNEEMGQRSADTSAIGNALNKGRLKGIADEIDMLKKREDFLLKVQGREALQATYSNEGARAAAVSKPELGDLKTLEEERKAREKAEKERTAAAERAAKESASAIKRAQEGAAAYIDSLDKQISKLNELSAAEKVIDDILKGRVQFTDAAQAGRAMDMAQQIDQSKRQAEQITAEADQLSKLTAGRDADYVAAKQIYEDLRTPLETYNAEIERLNYLQAQVPMSAETMSRAIAAATDRLKDATEKANQANNAMTEFAKQAERNIQDALGQTIEDSLAGNFESIGQMWVKLIQKMAAQALAAKLNDALFGSGSGSDAGGWIKLAMGIFGVADASTTAGNAALLQDMGTTSMAVGTNYVPRDNFPALLHKGEAVVPAKFNTGNSGAGGVTHIDFSGQTIHVGSDVSRGEVRAAVMAGNAETEMKIRRTLKQQRGG